MTSHGVQARIPLTRIHDLILADFGFRDTRNGKPLYLNLTLNPASWDPSRPCYYVGTNCPWSLGPRDHDNDWAHLMVYLDEMPERTWEVEDIYLAHRPPPVSDRAARIHPGLAFANSLQSPFRFSASRAVQGYQTGSLTRVKVASVTKPFVSWDSKLHLSSNDPTSLPYRSLALIEMASDTDDDYPRFVLQLGLCPGTVHPRPRPDAPAMAETKPIHWARVDTVQHLERRRLRSPTSTHACSQDHIIEWKSLQKSFALRKGFKVTLRFRVTEDAHTLWMDDLVLVRIVFTAWYRNVISSNVDLDQHDGELSQSTVPTTFIGDSSIHIGGSSTHIGFPSPGHRRSPETSDSGFEITVESPSSESGYDPEQSISDPSPRPQYREPYRTVSPTQDDGDGTASESLHSDREVALPTALPKPRNANYAKSMTSSGAQVGKTVHWHTSQTTQTFPPGFMAAISKSYSPAVDAASPSSVPFGFVRGGSTVPPPSSPSSRQATVAASTEVSYGRDLTNTTTILSSSDNILSARSYKSVPAVPLYLPQSASSPAPTAASSDASYAGSAVETRDFPLYLRSQRNVVDDKTLFIEGESSRASAGRRRRVLFAVDPADAGSYIKKSGVADASSGSRSRSVSPSSHIGSGAAIYPAATIDGHRQIESTSASASTLLTWGHDLSDSKTLNLHDDISQSSASIPLPRHYVPQANAAIRAYYESIGHNPVNSIPDNTR